MRQSINEKNCEVTHIIPENSVRYFSESDNILLILGCNSYIQSAIINGGDNLNIIIGNYSSIGDSVKFISSQDKNKSVVSTYSWEKLGLLEREANEESSRQIIIGNDVFIGDNVCILGGIKVGNGAILQTGSIINFDVPSYAIVEGNPARIVSYRFNKEDIKLMNQIKWWYWEENKIKENLPFKNVEQFIKEFLPIENVPELTETAIKFQEFKKTGFQIFYLFPVFSNPYSQWFNICDAFFEKCSSSEQILLVLSIDHQKNDDANIQKFEELVQLKQRKYGKKYNILIIYQQAINIAIIENIDYFITNSNFESLQYIDYAENYSVKILDGFSKNIFANIHMKQTNNPALLQDERLAAVFRQEILNKIDIQEYDCFLYHQGLGETCVFSFLLNEYKKRRRRKLLFFVLHPSRFELLGHCPAIDINIRISSEMFNYISNKLLDVYDVKNVFPLYFIYKTGSMVKRICNFLNLPENVKLQKFALKSSNEAKIKEMFVGMGLKEGKSVLIVPEAVCFGKNVVPKFFLGKIN